ncbi:uncharacterized protein LOC112689429 isoform X3 [Sipha flava]|uniref:Uncharacterized protein LOC112689429 isoform X3 n=1 Tax=Sipha flava TaxID=143950 RepID=A0A8B8G7U8_9HEMI|nr:uncharacterized protein LOC112689429 isoform X3 [Sipha flava]
MNLKIQLKSKIDHGFKKAAEKDKLEFIKQQMKIANEEDVRRRTCQILKFTASTFELLITVGYTFHMISKAKVKLQQIKLWMTNNKNTPGKPMNLRTPFRRRATEVRPSVAVPSVDVQSNFFAVLKSEPAKTKLSTSNSISDEGFESLVLGSSSSK